MTQHASTTNRPRTRRSLANFGTAAATACGIVGGSLIYVLFGLVLARWFWIGRVASHPINLCSMVAFAVAMAWLALRRYQIGCEEKWLDHGLLDAGADTLLLPDDVRELRKHWSEYQNQDRNRITMQILGAGLQRARAQWSASDVAEAVKNQAELVQGRIDVEYSQARYLAWAIPSIGFVGTVLGIRQAMATLSGETANIMKAASHHLATAFDTTFVALLLSLALMYFLHRVQARDDRLLVQATQAVMKILAFRMHVPQQNGCASGSSHVSSADRLSSEHAAGHGVIMQSSSC